MYKVSGGLAVPYIITALYPITIEVIWLDPTRR
jgi:hypothetical protein